MYGSSDFEVDTEEDSGSDRGEATQTCSTALQGAVLMDVENDVYGS